MTDRNKVAGVRKFLLEKFKANSIKEFAENNKNEIILLDTLTNASADLPMKLSDNNIQENSLIYKAKYIITKANLIQNLNNNRVISRNFISNYIKVKLFESN